MGCRIKITTTKTIAFRLYWRGRETQEGTGLRATTRNLERAKVLCRQIDHLVRSGKFTGDDYRHYFAFGSRRDVLGMGEPRRRVAVQPITVAEYAARWLEQQAPPAIPVHRHSDRRAKLRAWVLPYIGSVALRDLRPVIIEKWQADLFARPLSVNSVKGAIVSTFRAMWKHAQRHLGDELAGIDPFVSLTWPRQQRSGPQPLTEDEARLVVGHFRQAAPRYAPLIELLLGTGMRPSEAVALAWKHFDAERGWLTIERSMVKGVIGATKTAGSARSIPLAPHLVETLLAVRPKRFDPDALMFTNRLGRPVNQIELGRLQWAQALEALGIGRRGLYKTRHTYVSGALSAGANPKRIGEYVGTSIQRIEENYGRFIGRTDSDPFTEAARRNPDSSGIRVPGSDYPGNFAVKSTLSGTPLLASRTRVLRPKRAKARASRGDSHEPQRFDRGLFWLEKTLLGVPRCGETRVSSGSPVR